MWGRSGAAIVVAIAVLALALPAVAGASVARVSVFLKPMSRPIEDGFLGLALEYSTIPTWTASGAQPVNPVLVRLIRNLDPVGRPQVRIGGISTDRTWWPVPGLTKPLGITYALTPTWTRSARALAQALDAQLLLGINLEADRPKLSHLEADELLQGVGRHWISGFTIGNEPPLYTTEAWYYLLGGNALPWYDKVGQPVFSVGQHWGPVPFMVEFKRIASVLPPVPIAGPDTQDSYWVGSFMRFVGPRSRVRIVTSHAYGLNTCVRNPLQRAFPSVPHLLSTFASRHLMTPGLTRIAARAHRAHASYRIDEMGTITCNGYAGVSNTMAAALWAVDALFAVARAGVDGVNLHTYPHLPNDLFDFTHSPSGWVGTVSPLYYGALMFARSAPARSRLIQVVTRGPLGLRAWATSGPGRAIHVVVINDSLSTAATVDVRVPPRRQGARA